MNVLEIPRDWSVFVLEDDAARICWFTERIPNAVVVKNVEDALRILSESSFHAVFLDHDLCFADAAFPEARPGSGVRVANFLKSQAYAGLVVIHSVNELGAARMKTFLPEANVCPFGTFDLKCSG